MLAAKPAGEMESCSVLQTDDAFWKIFEFEFLSGKPYDNADFDAGAAKAVISEDMARRLFRNVRSGWKDIPSESFGLYCLRSGTSGL